MEPGMAAEEDGCRYEQHGAAVPCGKQERDAAAMKPRPMSRMKWTLAGPVSTTPGTAWYQGSGAVSMNRPLAAWKMARRMRRSRMIGTSMLVTTWRGGV